MEQIISFYRKGSVDCPVDISYFSPSVIREKPSYIEGSSRMNIVLIYQGQVELQVSGKDYMLTDGDIATILPYELFSLRSVTIDTQYVQAEFPLEFITLPANHFFQQDFVEPLRAGLLQVPRLIRRSDPLYETLFALLRHLEIKKEWSGSYKAELFSVILSFCTTIMPCCTIKDPSDAAPREGTDPIYLCIDYIRHHYAEKITLQTLADYVHLQPNYLCNLFKKRTGKTIFEHLIRYRINWSSKLLRSTAEPINRIAEQCGFTNVHFFNRKFSAIHGCSPTAYRKRFAGIVLSEE